MIRIIGIITFLGALATVLYMAYIMSEDGIGVNGGLIFGIASGALFSMLYTYLTKFGNFDPENHKVERENKLLKSKIEQKKLRKELEED